MQLSTILLIVPLLAGGVFCAPGQPPLTAPIKLPTIPTLPNVPTGPIFNPSTHAADDAYELVVKWKRDTNLTQLPDRVSDQLKAMGIDGSKGTFFVNGEEVGKGKRDLDDVNDVLGKRMQKATLGKDDAYELSVKWP